MQKEHWVFENDKGQWSLVDPKMQRELSSSETRFLVGPGINSAQIFPNDSLTPSHGIVSHMSAGMGGDRIWIQYNLKTGKPRLLSHIVWNPSEDLKTILSDGSMISGWRSCMKGWFSRDIPM